MELFGRLETALEKELPPNIRMTWYGCYELTLATRRESECYGEDTLFVFPAFDDAKGEYLHLVVKRDGSVQLFYEKWYEKAKRENREKASKRNPSTDLTLPSEEFIPYGHLKKQGLKRLSKDRAKG